ncbi:MAG: hypothetical protein U5L45_11530 [Saprospiraceae bacterium]|nr:hypothetical protein [Saprospiraceae bacterium]
MVHFSGKARKMNHLSSLVLWCRKLLENYSICLVVAVEKYSIA